LYLVEFVDWLWQLCIQNIHPGANFQRLDTCFRLIQVVLGSFELRPHQNQRKGGIPGTSLCYQLSSGNQSVVYFCNVCKLKNFSIPRHASIDGLTHTMIEQSNSPQ